MLTSIHPFTVRLAPHVSRLANTVSIPVRCFTLVVTLLALTACNGGDSSEQHTARARQYLAEAAYDAATIELKNALQQDKDSAEARWLLGKVYLSTGNILSAEKELLRAQELGWNINDIRPALAQTQLAQGKFVAVREAAYKDLTHTAAAQLLSVKALAELAQGETDEAWKLIAIALEKKPDLIEVKMAKARILADQGNLTDALLVLEKILEKAPDQSEAWSLKGDIFLRQQKLADALAAFDQSIVLSQNTFADRFKRALINLQNQDYNAAQADADLLLQAAPQHAGSNYIQGLLHFRTEKYPDAITALSQAEPAARQFPMLLFYLGSAHLIEGNRDQAEIFANRFVDLAPASINGRKLLATIKILQGKFKVAQELVQPVLDNNPHDIGALSLMANALLGDGKTEQGIDLLERVAQLQPDSPLAQTRLGAVLLMSGRGDEATQQFESALDLDPKFQQADIMLVLNRVQNKDFDGAMKLAEAYRSRNPVNAAAHNLLGKVYLANGRQQEAKDSFEKALTLNPGDPGANHNLAHMALAANDLAGARGHYQDTLEHHPDSLSTLLQLAEIDASEQQEDAMVEHLQQAMDSHPTALQPRLLLGRYYLRQGKPERIGPLFTTLDDLQKQSPRVLHLLTVSQLAAEQYSDAQYSLEQLIESTPDTAAYHHLLAMAAAGTGDSARAKQELQRTLAINENHLPALIALARMALSERAPADFNQYMKRLIVLSPDHPDVLGLGATAALRNGDTAEAIELGSRAYAAAPSTSTMLELAGYQKAAGDINEAQRIQEQWIQSHPQDVSARIALASTLEQKNRVADAIIQYQTVLKLETDNLIALNNLAWHVRLTEPAQALEYIRQASSLAPDQSGLLDTLAVIEHLNGNNLQAQRSIQRALVNAPDNPAMLYHHAMIEAALGDKPTAIAILQDLLGEDSADFSERAEAQALLASLKG